MAKKDFSESDVEERLESIRKSEGPWVPVERPVQINDMVIIDVTGSVGDKKIVDQENATYVVDSKNSLPLPGFSQHLKNMVPDEPKEFNLEIPSDYGDSSIAGRDIHFRVTVRETKEQDLPNLDDEFAKSVGEGYDTLKSLREDIMNGLKADTEKSQSAQYRDDVLKEFLQQASVKLAPLLIEHEVEHMEAKRDRFVDQLNIQLDDYLKYIGK